MLLLLLLLLLLLQLPATTALGNDTAAVCMRACVCIYAPVGIIHACSAGMLRIRSLHIMHAHEAFSFLGQVFHAPPAGRKALLYWLPFGQYVFFFKEATIPWRIVSKAHYGKD